MVSLFPKTTAAISKFLRITSTWNHNHNWNCHRTFSVSKTVVKRTGKYCNFSNLYIFPGFSTSSRRWISTSSHREQQQHPQKDKKEAVKMRPTGIIHNWDLRTYAPEQIKAKSLEIVEEVKGLADGIAKIDSGVNGENLTFDTVLNPLLQAYRLLQGIGGICTFPLQVSESSEIRDAASVATKLFNETSVETSMRVDIFEKLNDYKKKVSNEDIGPEYVRSLDKLIRHGRKNGLHLDKEIRDQVSNIKLKILDLELHFGRNLNDDKTTLLFSKDELAGMPSDFIDTLKIDRDTGKCIVTLEYPHLYPILRKCHVPSTRRLLQNANYSKCHPQNTKILEELLELRHQEANLLGYKNHGSYVLDGDTIANDPSNVKRFLEELAIKLQPLWEKEKEIMLGLKNKECEKYGYENSFKLENWDVGYYGNLVKEIFYNVDQTLLQPYFPLDVVTKGLLGIYEEILGLSFTYLPDAERWHEEVLVYQVDDADTGHLMGYFFLDLFPRDGKYGHACWVPLQISCPDQNGIEYPVVGAMLANFTRPTAEKPSLLTHDEVNTYFHEFGHVMHGICSKAKSPLFFGTRVERDFVEAPSQMLENWVWEKEPLSRMSSHYQTNVPLPDELLENLIKTKKVNAGGFNLRQIVLGSFDQVIHQNGTCNTQQIFADTLRKIQGLEAPPDSNFAAGFGHIGNAYSSRYYGYLWSEVFSMDMFKTKFSRNVLDKVTGKLYRKLILEPGGSIDGRDMLRQFLGRDPNSDAFLESKGVEPKHL